MTKVGDLAPEFELPDTKGDLHALRSKDHRAPTVVLFVSNKTAAWRRWFDRVVEVARETAGHDVRFLAISCPCQPVTFRSGRITDDPDDDLPGMLRAASEHDFGPIIYLSDPEQRVAREYGVRVIPDVFVVDTEGRVRYHGGIGPSFEDESDPPVWLRDGVTAVLEGREPSLGGHSVGVPIRWLTKA